MMKKILLVVSLLLTYSVYSQITEIGLASYYADKFDGRITASGDIFNQKKLTAAHRTLPFGTIVKVTNLNNKKTVEVSINDRGPFVNDRVIDLSKAAAEQLNFLKKGVCKVKIEVIQLKVNKEPVQNTSSKPVIKNKKKQTTHEEPGSSSVQKIDKDQPLVEYYKIESKSIIPVGFGIQIASYKEAANLLKRVEDIKKQVYKDVFIQIGGTGGNRVYRIMIGTFESYDQAQFYNDKIKKQFNGSFVKAF